MTFSFARQREGKQEDQRINHSPIHRFTVYSSSSFKYGMLPLLGSEASSPAVGSRHHRHHRQAENNVLIVVWEMIF